MYGGRGSRNKNENEIENSEQKAVVLSEYFEKFHGAERVRGPPTRECSMLLPMEEVEVLPSEVKSVLATR